MISVEEFETTGVQLTWEDNSDIETRYRVLRSTDGVNFASLEVLPANRTSYTDEDGIESGVEYTYKVVAQNAVFESESNLVEITPNNIVTSIDNDLERQVMVFPNPADELISIQSESLSFEADPIVIDLLGNRILLPVRRLSTHEISISTRGLPSGIYLIQFSRQGETFQRRFSVIH